MSLAVDFNKLLNKRNISINDIDEFILLAKNANHLFYFAKATLVKCSFLIKNSNDYKLALEEVKLLLKYIHSLDNNLQDDIYLMIIELLLLTNNIIDFKYYLSQVNSKTDLYHYYFLIYLKNFDEENIIQYISSNKLINNDSYLLMMEVIECFLFLNELKEIPTLLIKLFNLINSVNNIDLLKQYFILELYYNIKIKNLDYATELIAKRNITQFNILSTIILNEYYLATSNYKHTNFKGFKNSSTTYYHLQIILRQFSKYNFSKLRSDEYIYFSEQANKVLYSYNKILKNEVTSLKQDVYNIRTNYKDSNNLINENIITNFDNNIRTILLNVFDNLSKVKSIFKVKIDFTDPLEDFNSYIFKNNKLYDYKINFNKDSIVNNIIQKPVNINKDSSKQFKEEYNDQSYNNDLTVFPIIINEELICTITFINQDTVIHIDDYVVITYLNLLKLNLSLYYEYYEHIEQETLLLELLSKKNMYLYNKEDLLVSNDFLNILNIKSISEIDKYICLNNTFKYNNKMINNYNFTYKNDNYGVLTILSDNDNDLINQSAYSKDNNTLYYGENNFYKHFIDNINNNINTSVISINILDFDNVKSNKEEILNNIFSNICLSFDKQYFFNNKYLSIIVDTIDKRRLNKITKQLFEDLEEYNINIALFVNKKTKKYSLNDLNNFIYVTHKKCIELDENILYFDNIYLLEELRK